MLREIKFRGKFSDAHPWCFGYYYNNCDYGVNQNFIVSPNHEEGTGDHFIIDTKYLGQFTGLTDEDGKEIYEGDILAGGYEVVFFKSGFYGVRHRKDDKIVNSLGQCSSRKNFKVIGNKYDNPDLLRTAREPQ